MTAIAANKESVTKSATTNVGRNLLWMVWSGSVGIANSVLLWIFIARMRDVEELGRFTIVMGLYALFFSICSLGLTPFLVSEISRKSESDDDESPEKNEQKLAGFISSATVFLFASGVVCCVLMTICAFLVSESWSVRVSALILSLAMIPTGLISAGEATAVSFGQTRLIAFASTLENVLRTVVPFALIWYGFDITVVCASFAAVRFAALLVYLWSARHKLARFTFNAVDFVEILKVSPTFAGTIILASINWQAAIILLSLCSSEAESAKYGVASRFLIPVSILMASYASVIQPIITQYAQKSIRDTGFYLSKMVGYPLVLSTLAAVVSPFLSSQVLTVFFGAGYADAAPTLDLLAMSVVPFCVVMIVSRGLIATGSQHVDFLANAIGVAICITASSILIPRSGATGAAVAQFLSFLAIALTETVYLSRKISGFHVWQKACVSSICLLGIYFFIWKP
ncbi:MAG TPA: oligosaccharide flippase family protein [Pyrinomonadaceae bacterium]|nr:oligosaccharide flippase family protein [Pyrinomonadaceae bacterium]